MMERSLFDQGTRHFGGAQTAYAGSASHGAALTRVGSIMGTPIYMSPEQCAGGHLDARADIYSIGVIAYQMLAGEPPFSGNTNAVMRAHREENPRQLRERAGKIPKRMAAVIMRALAKEPADRPQTAFAFASSLRGQSEGISSLYRRAVSLYSEYFPKFVKMSFIAHIPVIAFTLLIVALQTIEKVRPAKGLVQKIIFISLMIVAAGEITLLIDRYPTDGDSYPTSPTSEASQTASGLWRPETRWRPF